MVRRPLELAATVPVVGVHHLRAAALHRGLQRLKPGADIVPSPWSLPSHPTLANLRAVLDRPDRLFWNGLVNIIEIAATSMIAVTLISAMLGYAIARSAHIGAKIVLVFVVCGLMVPSTVILTPITQILRYLGLMNTAPGLVLVNMSYYIAFGIFLFAGFVRTVPNRTGRGSRDRRSGSAADLLADRVPTPVAGVRRRTDLPRVWILSDFLNPLIILGLTSGTTVAVGVYRAIGEHSSDLGALFGFMSLASVSVLIFFLAFQRHFVTGLTGGATK